MGIIPLTRRYTIVAKITIFNKPAIAMFQKNTEATKFSAFIA